MDEINPKMLTWRERGWLWLRMGIRLVLTVVALLVLFLLVPRVLSLLMPFVIAFLAAWLLNPLVHWIHQKLHVSRKVISLVIILLVFSLAGGLIFWLCYTVGREITTLVTEWGGDGASLQNGLTSVTAWLDHLFAALPADLSAWLSSAYDSIVAQLETLLGNLLTRVGQGVGSVATQVPSAVVAVVVFLMASYFMIADYPRYRDRFSHRLQGRSRTFWTHLRSVAVNAFSGYFKAQLLLSVGVFFILLVGFLVTRQPMALLLALFMAIVDFIPIVGSGTFLVPWAVIDLITGNYRQAIQLMVIWGLVCLFRRVAEPKIVGDQTGLSPILSLISIYVGMRVGGIIGMILGPILLLIILNLYRAGVFPGLRRDIHMAVEDLRTILDGGRTQEPDADTPPKED